MVDDFIEDDFIPDGDHQNLLQKAVQGAGALIPQSGQELGDVGRGLGRLLPMGEGGKVSPKTMGPFGLGLNIAGVDEIGGIPRPETEWGQVMEEQVTRPASLLAPLGVLGKQAAVGGVKGLWNLFNTGAAKRALADTVSKSSTSASSSVGRMAGTANEEFGAGLSQMKDTGYGSNALRDVFKKTAYKIDPGGTTFANAESMAGKVLKAGDDFIDDAASYSGEQLQAKYMELNQLMGRIGSKAQGAFGKFFRESLPEAFQKLKSTRAGVYGLEKAAKPLTKPGTLNRIAKRTAGDVEVSQLRDVQGAVPGLNVMDDLIRAGKKVSRTQTARKVGKGLALSGGGLGTLGWLASKMKGS